MTAPAGQFTKDASNRLRFRGQGHRGRPSEIRAALVDLAHAHEEIIRARVHLALALQTKDGERATALADGRARADLALRFTRAALRRGAIKAAKRPVDERQTKLRFARR